MTLGMVDALSHPMLKFAEMSAHPPTITLLTDFGLEDPYVGIMHGVILNIVPRANLVDLTHTVPPQAVDHAAFLLATAVAYFPPDTVHLVVVDPGVGTTRRPIAVRTEHAFYVAPDNGVLDLALARQPPERCVQLTEQRYWLAEVSATFHGRDIFAPVAAHLARGVPIDQLGRPVRDLTHRPSLQVEREPDGRLRGRIQHIDRFGNCVTNVPAELLLNRASIIKVGDATIQGLAVTYAAAEPGELVALIGSHGFLEIAVRNGSAADHIDGRVGERIVIEPT
jgi:S-adenosylmethionine hydrolase